MSNTEDGFRSLIQSHLLPTFPNTTHFPKSLRVPTNIYKTTATPNAIIIEPAPNSTLFMIAAPEAADCDADVAALAAEVSAVVGAVVVAGAEEAVVVVMLFPAAVVAVVAPALAPGRTRVIPALAQSLTAKTSVAATSLALQTLEILVARPEIKLLLLQIHLILVRVQPDEPMAARTGA